jgi:hypothetical protein
MSGRPIDLDDPIDVSDGDEIVIARALRDDYESVCRDAAVPTAGSVFWRASIRARAEAAQAVDQPMTIANGIATAAVAGAGLAFVGIAWRVLPAVARWRDLIAADGWTAVALCAAAIVVISPLAVAALGSRTRFDRPQD